MLVRRAKNPLWPSNIRESAFHQADDVRGIAFPTVIICPVSYICPFVTQVDSVLSLHVTTSYFASLQQVIPGLLEHPSWT